MAPRILSPNSDAWRVAFALALFASALLFAVPVRAAEPWYLAEMPTPEAVIEKTQGTDPFDTAARQYAAFSLLESMTRELMRDRFAAGEQTPAEWALTVVYHDNYLRIQREMLASLPEQEREYRPDTRYGQWRALVDQYCCSEANLEDQLLETFFSPEFREAYAPIRAAAEARAAEFFAPGPPPPPEPPDYTLAYLLGGLALFVYVFFYMSGAISRGGGRRRGD